MEEILLFLRRLKNDTINKIDGLGTSFETWKVPWTRARAEKIDSLALQSTSNEIKTNLRSTHWNLHDDYDFYATPATLGGDTGISYRPIGSVASRKSFLCGVKVIWRVPSSPSSYLLRIKADNVIVYQTKLTFKTSTAAPITLSANSLAEFMIIFNPFFEMFSTDEAETNFIRNESATTQEVESVIHANTFKSRVLVNKKVNPNNNLLVEVSSDAGTSSAVYTTLYYGVLK